MRTLILATMVLCCFTSCYEEAFSILPQEAEQGTAIPFDLSELSSYDLDSYERANSNCTYPEFTKEAHTNIKIEFQAIALEYCQVISQDVPFCLNGKPYVVRIEGIPPEGCNE